MSLICISFVLFLQVPLFLLIAPVAKLLVRAGKILTSDWTKSGGGGKISCFRLAVKSLTRFHMYYCRQSTSHSPLACEPVHIVTHPLRLSNLGPKAPGPKALSMFRGLLQPSFMLHIVFHCLFVGLVLSCNIISAFYMVVLVGVVEEPR